MDVGYDVAWCDEYKHGYEHGGDVEQNDVEHVYLYGHRADVIGSGVEFGESREALQKDYAESEYVTDEESLADDERRKP